MRTVADDGGTRTSSGYSHDLLLHDSDAELIAGTRAFVQRGRTAGGKVLVLGTDSQIAMLREALGTHPGLTYARDRTCTSPRPPRCSTTSTHSRRAPSQSLCG